MRKSGTLTHTTLECKYIMLHLFRIAGRRYYTERSENILVQIAGRFFGETIVFLVVG